MPDKGQKERFFTVIHIVVCGKMTTFAPQKNRSIIIFANILRKSKVNESDLHFWKRSGRRPC